MYILFLETQISLASACGNSKIKYMYIYNLVSNTKHQFSLFSFLSQRNLTKAPGRSTLASAVVATGLRQWSTTHWLTIWAK